jgi:hypothetical protein
MKHSKFATTEAIEKNKAKIIKKLESWAFTFIDEPDEEVEMTGEDGQTYTDLIPDNGYETVVELVEKLKTNTCTEKDYQEIEFHLLQMKGLTA